METRTFKKEWVSQMISYSILSWTMVCFIGTWFIILNYGILLNGLIAIMTTFFFAAVIWVVPFMGLVLLSLWAVPTGESSLL